MIPFSKTPLALKLGVILAAFALIPACSDDNNRNDPPVVTPDPAPGDGGDETPERSLSFTGVPAPASDSEKRQILAAPSVAIDGEEYEIGFHTLLRSGDSVNSSVVFGQLVDAAGQPLYGEDGMLKVTDANEHTSLLPVGDRLFSVSQMETRPGAMFLMELDQNPESGELSTKDLWQIDQSGVDGGWVHCAASVTPWNAHLASEEYEPDARALPTHVEVEGDRYSRTMLSYYADPSQWNPYFYGWNIEINVAAEGDAAPTAELTKHYAMGRLAFELSYVMPDSKTVYMTDDGTNVGFYMFIADTAGDLSAGTVYAAKWNQTSGEGLGAADLEWVSLGHANDDEINVAVHGGDGVPAVTFDDIFAVDGEGCVETATNGNSECLSVKPGMEKIASRLETRRYAALMGATTEFRKEEGVTFDPAASKLYLAMSQVGKGMTDGTGHVQIAEANACGAVYQLDVATDSEIGSDYVATNMGGLIGGIALDDESKYPADSPFASYSCDADAIANPDNVTFITGYNTLIIGEDTGSGHQNDVIWSLNLDEVDAADSTAGLTRIQTTPYGSETTSPYWYPNINGFGYLMSVIQHPYGESDGDQLAPGSLEHRAYTGYVGPFPAMDVTAE
ncbi:alkaline phosphatase PhoX [uncultured Microbulbifer sp.]|uniref:PhoX family protein n=1 Tax=uncultured Microbulbifer sp. TaxID=348147 RepID=UPI0025EAA907|nr:alkaline phosphatase PhoX [uncultured Microbulbifer sp.]